MLLFVPVVKLSMLGVDKSLQGQGIGKRLLRDVFLKVYQISQLAGRTGIYWLKKMLFNFMRILDLLE